MNASGDTSITCKNCGHIFEGRYCNNCGEKVYTRHDKTIIHLVEEGTHFITHFDGTFFNTLKALTIPGKLSTDYCSGIRKRYFKPISFFLLIVILYLLFPLMEGLNQKLIHHLDNPFYGSFATKKVTYVLRHTGLLWTQVSEIFHEKAEKVSKLLLLILLPVSALILQLLTFKKRRLFFDQVIFATEFNIVFILFGFMVFPFILRLFHYVLSLFTKDDMVLLDTGMGIIILIVMMTYLVMATRKFYRLKLLSAILLSMVFIILYGLFFQAIYKFILFLITISLVH